MRKVNRNIVELEIQKEVTPFGGDAKMASYHAHVTRHSADFINRRLRMAESVGLIRRGGDGKSLNYMILMNREKFLKKIAQATSGLGLTENQQGAYVFLRELDVPHEEALVLSRKKNSRKAIFVERARVLSKISLEVSRFGTERIPFSMYKRIIGLPPTKIKRYLYEKILRDLENKHAEQVLDAVMPYWRRVPLIKNMEVRIILEKVSFLINNGIQLHGYYIRKFSTNRLARELKRLRHLTPEEQRNLMQRLETARNKTDK